MNQHDAETWTGAWDSGRPDKPENMVIAMADHPNWRPDECIDIFWRLLIMGWLQPSRMSVEMARDYGERLGHYGRLALEKQGQGHVVR